MATASCSSIAKASADSDAASCAAKETSQAPKTPEVFVEEKDLARSADRSTSPRTQAPLERLTEHFTPDWMRVKSTDSLPSRLAELTNLKGCNLVDETVRRLPDRVREALSEVVRRVELYLLLHDITININGLEATIPVVFVSDDAIESAESVRAWIDSRRSDLETAAGAKKIDLCRYVRGQIRPLFDSELPETDSLRLLLSESSRRLYLATSKTSLDDVAGLVRSRLNAESVETLKVQVLSRLPARDVLTSSAPVQTAIKLATDAWNADNVIQKSVRSTFLRLAAFLASLSAASAEIAYDAAIFTLALCLVPINYILGFLRHLAAMALSRVQQCSVHFNVKSHIHGLRQTDIRQPIEARVGDRLSPETIGKVASLAESALGVIERSVEMLETAALDTAEELDSEPKLG